MKDLDGELVSDRDGETLRLTVNLLRDVDPFEPLPLKYVRVHLTYQRDRLACSDVTTGEGFVKQALAVFDRSDGVEISTRYENAYHHQYRIPVVSVRCRPLSVEPTEVSGRLELTRIWRPMLDLELKDVRRIPLGPAALPSISAQEPTNLEGNEG
jgi:hypothetical protein